MAVIIIGTVIFLSCIRGREVSEPACGSQVVELPRRDDTLPIYIETDDTHRVYHLETCAVLVSGLVRAVDSDD